MRMRPLRAPVIMHLFPGDGSNGEESSSYNTNTMDFHYLEHLPPTEEKDAYRAMSNACRTTKKNRWVQDGITGRRAGSQRPPITSSREDRHFTRIAFMECAATSRALSQELGRLFCLLHQEGRIRIWRQRGECPLAACILPPHTCPSLSVMVCGAIGCTSRSPLFRIDGTLSSAR
ncbi:uncharacterized protein TNCV_4549901 [Trichonephila clavipes]|nr:uncharacterized protein TNCV_4549901 [Trichonephila clavipes]